MNDCVPMCLAVLGTKIAMIEFSDQKQTCGHRARVGVHLDGDAQLRAVERLELRRDLGETVRVSVCASERVRLGGRTG